MMNVPPEFHLALMIKILQKVQQIFSVQVRSLDGRAKNGEILCVLTLLSNPFRPSTQRMNAQLAKILSSAKQI
jgi:hypothetical protein